MKKFGLLPRTFDLKEFLVRANGQQVAGFYDDETRTISLLNWIPRDKQEPILAHELTHALQDQNYDLKTWSKAGMSRGTSIRSGKFEVDDEETLIARHAVTEGQAMVVFFDYMLAPTGRTLKDTPGLVASMEDPSVTAVIDTALMHSAPSVLRESGTFPYREGLFFEAALLERGGKGAAFRGLSITRRAALTRSYSRMPISGGKDCLPYESPICARCSATSMNCMTREGSESSMSGHC